MDHLTAHLTPTLIWTTQVSWWVQRRNKAVGSDRVLNGR